jgi:hypothetical protein
MSKAMYLENPNRSHFQTNGLKFLKNLNQFTHNAKTVINNVE